MRPVLAKPPNSLKTDVPCCHSDTPLQDRQARFHDQLRQAGEELAQLDAWSNLADDGQTIKISAWSTFDWQRDCKVIHQGTMKVVGQLREYPHIALVSVQAGSGALEIENEVNLLSELVDVHGVRTVPFSRTIMDVPHFNPCSEVVSAKGYLQYYFSHDMCFPFVCGEPGSEDYYEDSMRKLRICQEDEGLWEFNGDSIQILNRHGLQKEFMEDLSNYVELLAKKIRVVDLQGMLGLDGHFYIADPLRLWAINSEFSQYFLEGVFKHPANVAKQYEAYAEFGVYFIEGLGLNLEALNVDVDDDLRE